MSEFKSGSFIEGEACEGRVLVVDDEPDIRKVVKMTNWPTLPKVFIDGQFYGDTDILDPMAAKGEIEPLLKKAFGK